MHIFIFNSTGFAVSLGRYLISRYDHSRFLLLSKKVFVKDL